MTSKWGRRHLKSPLFTQPFFQAQIKENIKASRHWLFVRGIHWWPVNSPHKEPVTQKIFPFDNLMMDSYGLHNLLSCKLWQFNPNLTARMDFSYLKTWKSGITLDSSGKISRCVRFSCSGGGPIGLLTICPPGRHYNLFAMFFGNLITIPNFKNLQVQDCNFKWHILSLLFGLLHVS